MSVIIDDKSEHCIPFILKRIKAHREPYLQASKDAPPFFLGLNGVQGAGKTTLVSSLYETLTSPPLSLPTVVLSIDDLYLPHTVQQRLAASHPTNPLIQHRGQPSTHDIPLGASVFSALAARESNVRIPAYDKSAFSGQGDRTNPETWSTVNVPDEPPIEIVIFEGWSVGFRALEDDDLIRKWEDAKATLVAERDAYHGRLARLELPHLNYVNEALSEYDALTENDNIDMIMKFTIRVLIREHSDAQDTQFVYDWRLQQEAALRKAKGTGMTDDQVIDFVNGYYPAYELYTDVLRKGIFTEPGKQLRLVVDKSRRVKEVHEL